MKSIIKKLAKSLKSEKLISMAERIDRDLSDGILINITELESVLGDVVLDPATIDDVSVDL
jgi:hypothetical protein